VVTVVFVDVADSTAMFESLDPEEVHYIMDGSFKILMEEIHRYEGTINQFRGDGVMAIFGAPVAHEDHAQRACYASLGIQKATTRYAERLREDYGIEFKMRIGLNSGSVVVGSIGDDLRMDYTADGDTTNLAARMENLARLGTILVSGHTHRLVKDFFEFETIGRVEVKGKSEPQEAFELLKPSEVETRIGASVAKGLNKFVGRKDSIASLRGACNKANSGSGQVVTLVGEAGIGKSRALLEFKNQLPPDEFNYLEGRCIHFGGSMAYLPILDMMRSYFEIKEVDQEAIIKKKMADKILDLDEKLMRILPPLQALFSLEIDDEAFSKLEPKEKRERTFEAIQELIIRLDMEQPLVLAVEDLHWIDKTSEEFLGYLIDCLNGTNILLILLYRPEYEHQWASRSYYSRIDLHQLETETSIELVTAILEGGEITTDLKQLILNRAAGNPLFIEEFTRTLLENDTIERKEKKYFIGEKATDIPVPDTIQGIIAARMDRLDDNLKRTMQTASAIGRDFAFSILQKITDIREELESHLLNLQGFEFIYQKRFLPELEYMFKHALTQEVAYNSLLFKKRKKLHEKIGQAIEEIYPERIEELYEMLAFHYSKGENQEKAYKYLKLSASKMNQKYSLWESFRYYKEAIEVLNSMPETGDKKLEPIRIRLPMATAMIQLVFPEDSLDILEEGERLSTELDDEDSLTQFVSLKGLYYVIKGENPGLGIDYMEKSFHVAQRIGKIEILAPIALDLCISYNFVGSYLKTMEVAPRALYLLEKCRKQFYSFGRPHNPYSIICSYHALAMEMMGEFEEGRRQYEKGVQSAKKMNDLHSMSLLELNHGMAHNVRGEGEAAIKHLEECIRYCEEGNILIYLGLAWSGMGWGTCLLGNLDRARMYIEKGIKIHQDAEMSAFLSLHYLLAGMVEIDANDLSSAQKFIEEGLQWSQKLGEKWVEGLCLAFLGRVLGKKGKTESKKAEDCLKKGIQIVKDLKTKPLYSQCCLILAGFYLENKRQTKALINLLKARKMFKEMGMDYWLDLSKRKE